MKKLLTIMVLLVSFQLFAQDYKDFSTRPDSYSRSVKILKKLLGNSDSTRIADFFFLVNWEGIDTTGQAKRVDSIEVTMNDLLSAFNSENFATRVKQIEIIDSLNAVDSIEVTMNDLLSAFNNENFATRVKQIEIIDSLNAIINKFKYSGKRIISGTATNNWSQVIAVNCNGFEVRNIGSSNLDVAFSSSPGDEYISISPQISRKFPYQNTDEIYIKGNDNYKIFAK